MFFENFYEDLAALPTELTGPLAAELFEVDLTDPKLDREEYCFKGGGKLILPLHLAQVRDEKYFALVKPLLDYADSLQLPCLAGSTPFRIEVSIILGDKDVLWHYDQHLFHKFSERLHFPIITNDQVDFLAKWYNDDTIWKFQMKPGRVYRFNNRVPHSVKNRSPNFRCHVMVDYVKNDVLGYFKKLGNVAEMTRNVQVSRADELFYYTNYNPTGVVKHHVLTPAEKAKLNSTGY